MRRNSSVVVFGASGHGKVVADILKEQSGFRLAGFADDDKAKRKSSFFGVEVLGSLEEIMARFGSRKPLIIVGLGDSRLRMRVARRFVEKGFDFCTAIHPSAVVAKGVKIGKGTAIMAGAVVNSDTVMGEHVVINTGATVDHDCSIGDGVHVAPGVHLAGNVQVGREAFIGIGASVIPGRVIGEKAVVGAGAVVIRNVPKGQTVAGCPAKPL